MSDSVILSTPVIFILSIIAMFAFVIARIIVGKNVKAILYIGGFLIVAGCVTYSLLLGADIEEILVYLLVFVMLGMLEFIRPTDKPSEKHENSTDKITAHEQNDISRLSPSTKENSVANDCKDEVTHEF